MPVITAEQSREYMAREREHTMDCLARYLLAKPGKQDRLAFMRRSWCKRNGIKLKTLTTEELEKAVAGDAFMKELRIRIWKEHYKAMDKK